MRYSSIYKPPSVHLLECFAGPLKKAHDNQISHHSGYDEHAMNEEQWDDPQPYLTLTGYPLPLTLTANSCLCSMHQANYYHNLRIIYPPDSPNRLPTYRALA